MSGGLHMADFPALTLWRIRLYPLINPGWSQLYSNNIPLLPICILQALCASRDYLQREGKASLHICQGRAYGGCG